MATTASVPERKSLPLTSITADDRVQPRAHKPAPDVVLEYAEAMRNGDRFPSLVVFHDGTTYWLAEGFHRFEAAQCAEKADFECTIHPGTLRDAILYAAGTNSVHGVRRTNADKRNVVMKLLNDEEWSKRSDNWIAQQCKVTHPFVGKLRADLVTITREPQTERTVQRGGTTYTQNTANIGKSKPTQMHLIDDTALAGTVEIKPEPKKDPEVDLADKSFKQSIDYAEAAIHSLPDRPEVTALLDEELQRRKPRGTFGTGDNEWNTPAEYINLAREVLGGFDLDPATNEAAQRYIQAARHFTVEDDGLDHDWHGHVWLNPPYAQPLMTQFVEKLLDEVDAGRVTSAIMLTNNYSDTVWFHEAITACDAVCFTKGRIRFEKPGHNAAQPTQGQTFFYFGKDVARFADVFGDMGFIVTRRPCQCGSASLVMAEAAE